MVVEGLSKVSQTQGSSMTTIPTLFLMPGGIYLDEDLQVICELDAEEALVW